MRINKITAAVTPVYVSIYLVLYLNKPFIVDVNKQTNKVQGHANS